MNLVAVGASRYTPPLMQANRPELSVLLDSRMALRGLGIATFVERLEVALSAHKGVSVSRWQGSGVWGPRGQLSTLWHSGLFDISPRLDPRTGRFDAVHFVSNVGSMFPGPRGVLTVHDMLYRRHQRGRDRIYGFLLERSLARAQTVVAVSSLTATTLESAFPHLVGAVEVIPHGKRRLEMPSGERRHVLAFGGGSDPRKRIDLMIAVYREYRATTPGALPLVVLARAGLTTEQTRLLAEAEAQIVFDATGPEVDRFVAAAAVVLYTTMAEGFGLPVLEAGEVGTPVVLDAEAEIPMEVRGRHCVPVQEEDLRSWVAALRGAISDGPVPDALDLPDWEVVAGRYVQLYHEASRR